MARWRAQLTFLFFMSAMSPVCLAPVCLAQAAEEQDGTALHTEMLGAPVYAADGVLIGQVADISYDEEEQPTRIRMSSGAVLGIGQRTLEIPAGLFTVLRGAVVVDLPAEAVQSLPELVDAEEER
jgi:sporulation protein YlmC with PRC-barrel domain